MIKRRGRPERAVIVAALAGAAAGCGVEAANDVKYSTDECRRVSLIDQSTGATVRGAEDMALDVVRDRLFISAYDRRATERAAKRNAFSVPQGGLYAVSFSALIDAETSANAAPIVRPDDVPGGLRPHGMSLDPHTGEISFINRSYQRINHRWKMTPRIERASANGEIYVGDDRDAPCAANDLVDGGRELLVSFDHEACNWRQGLEDIAGLKRSGIATEDGKALFSDVSYANGIARTREGDVVLAATREKALLVMDEDSSGFSVRSRIDLAGGPDNLTLGADGAVIAALHPSMLRIGLHRRLGWGAAPSRIVKADPQSGAVEVLFDDPDGKLFSAASVGVEHGDALVVGSATDEGVLVCRAAG